MHLIQLFLPLYDNEGQRFERGLFDAVRGELTERFGGATAFTRTPALGEWADDAGEVQRDEVVLVEVMSEALDRDWWAGYRKELETRFHQDAVLIRAVQVEML